MSGYVYRDGKLSAAPECPPGAHDKLWTRTSSGGLYLRCDACLTIMTMTAEAAGRLRAMMEPKEEA